MAIEFILEPLAEEKNILSILIIKNGFYFMVHSPLDKKIFTIDFVNFGDLINETGNFDVLAKALNNFDTLHEDYIDVRIFYQNNISTLIPSSLYHNDCIEIFLETVQKVPLNHVFSSDYIIGINAWNIFAYPSEVENVLMQYTTRYKVFHSNTILIEAFQLFCKINDKENNTLLHYTDDFIYLICFRDNELISSISFDYKTSDDAVFKTINSLKRSEIDFISSNLWISGNILEDDILIATLKKFIPDTAILPCFDGIEIPSGKDFHKYFNIISASLCEL